MEKANLDRAKSFAEACGRKYGDLLPHMTTTAAARDLDVVRQALGAERINYFGYSYGTYLGTVYAKLYPQRVRRLVLDSVVDPTGVWYDSNLDQNQAFNARHRAFMDWVAKHDATYRLGSDAEKIEAAWYAMRSALKEKPADGKVGPAELEDTFVPGGYYNGYWPYLAEAFAAYVNDGDDGPLVEAYENFGATDVAGDNGYSVYTAVECRDAPGRGTGRSGARTTGRCTSGRRSCRGTTPGTTRRARTGRSRRGGRSGSTPRARCRPRCCSRPRTTRPPRTRAPSPCTGGWSGRAWWSSRAAATTASR